MGPKYGSKEYLKEAKQKAKKIGYNVEYSRVKGKKLDVFNKKGEKVASIGGDPKIYSDYIQNQDKEKKKNYKARHQKYRNIKGSKSYYSDKILW
jgi:hypothetical protein